MKIEKHVENIHMKIIVEKCNPTIENDNILIQYNLNSNIYTHLGSLLLSQQKKKVPYYLLIVHVLIKKILEGKY